MSGGDFVRGDYVRGDNVRFPTHRHQVTIAHVIHQMITLQQNNISSTLALVMANQNYFLNQNENKHFCLSFYEKENAAKSSQVAVITCLLADP